MSDANEQEQKRPLTLSRSGGRLELRKSVEMGQVRQSFSHGRSKTVTVEVRKKRTIGPTPESAGSGAGSSVHAGTNTGGYASARYDPSRANRRRKSGASPRGARCPQS